MENEATIRLLQVCLAALKRAGEPYYSGSFDGATNDTLFAAYNKFQVDNNIPASEDFVAGGRTNGALNTLLTPPLRDSVTLVIDGKGTGEVFDPSGASETYPSAIDYIPSPNGEAERLQGVLQKFYEDTHLPITIFKEGFDVDEEGNVHVIIGIAEGVTWLVRGGATFTKTIPEKVIKALQEKLSKVAEVDKKKLWTSKVVETSIWLTLSTKALGLMGLDVKAAQAHLVDARRMHDDSLKAVGYMGLLGKQFQGVLDAIQKAYAELSLGIAFEPLGVNAEAQITTRISWSLPEGDKSYTKDQKDKMISTIGGYLGNAWKFTNKDAMTIHTAHKFKLLKNAPALTKKHLEYHKIASAPKSVAEQRCLAILAEIGAGTSGIQQVSWSDLLEIKALLSAPQYRNIYNNFWGFKPGFTDEEWDLIVGFANKIVQRIEAQLPAYENLTSDGLINIKKWLKVEKGDVGFNAAVAGVVANLKNIQHELKGVNKYVFKKSSPQMEASGVLSPNGLAYVDPKTKDVVYIRNLFFDSSIKDKHREFAIFHEMTHLEFSYRKAVVLGGYSDKEDPNDRNSEVAYTKRDVLRLSREQSKKHTNSLAFLIYPTSYQP